MTSVEEGIGNVSYNRAAVSKCQRWVFDHSVFESTIATDFSLVCDRSVFRSTSNVVAEIGTLIGTGVSGLAADRFGRKLPFYIGALALMSGGFGIAFTTNFIVLNFCRFLIGLARMTLWVNGLVIGMEIVGPSKRVFAGTFIELVWCVGAFLLLLFAYFIRNWRYLEIAVSVPSCVLLAYWWLIPESPRWLASKGREKEVLLILEKIASSNKTKLPDVDDVSKSLVEKQVSLSFIHLFKSRELIVRFVVVFSNMYMLNVIYYALMYNITNLSGDIYINYLITVASETIGLVLPYFLLDRLGRKCVTCASTLIGGAACVASVVPALANAPDWVVVVLSTVGRFFVCMGYSTTYIYAAELFPTVIRASAMGVGVTIVRSGSIVAPYIADVGILVGGRLANALPLIVMGGPALVVGFFVLWLPETMGTKLPETLDDVSNLQSARGCVCCKDGNSDERERAVTRELDNTDPEV
ncbi:organic cation transporter protein-like isoform X3 [Littorina saxatilis]